MTDPSGAATSITGDAGVIDCDVQTVVPKVDALIPYLTDHWKEYVAQSAFRGPVDTAYPKGFATTARAGTQPPGGGPAGSDIETTCRQALAGVEFAILNNVYSVDSVHNPDSAMAMARSVNDWTATEWLPRDARLRASMTVPIQQPTIAAEEIARAGGRDRFVQVLLPARTRIPLGNRVYHPIYEAATRHGLTIGIHFGGAPGNAPTGVGWPSYYIEEFAGMAQVAQSQVASLIAEGVFERFPTLTVVFIEVGWTWVPSLMWQLDRAWRSTRRTVPWVRKPPSDAIREHIRLTLTPTHAPSQSGLLAQIVEQMGTDEMLLFSSAYPREHGEDPSAILSELPRKVVRRIRSENARATYRL
ncbi:MAG: amidohydrolase [Chloroflexota bacterium]|nr:MAG: amidohydrolase [Chloroflexota bacterium]